MEFLEIKNASITFGKKKVIRNFNYTFRPGVTVITGRNGVGKSTLLSIASTLTSPDTGEVSCSIIGVKQPLNIIKNGTFVPDKPDFYHFITIKEFLKLMKKIKGLSYNLHESTLFNEFNLVKHLYTPFHALSFGTKKKVFLLVALTIDASVIILDEPTNGLDAESHKVLIKHIKNNHQAGHIIIMSSHDEEFIRHFDATMIAL